MTISEHMKFLLWIFVKPKCSMHILKTVLCVGNQANINIVEFHMSWTNSVTMNIGMHGG